MSRISPFMHQACMVTMLRDGAGQTDGRLLENFISLRDETALAAIVRRHGPMVLGVCRRILRNHHDAEDAFQATFIVLVRKAASIASRELLANWLYGVAHRTALKARAATAKRIERERPVTEMPEPAVVEPDTWHEVGSLLDQELVHLPKIYRTVIILCDLSGKTRRDAARELGVPEGTIAGRLARARVMLANRIGRQGVGISAGVLATLLSQNAVSASVPTCILTSTIKAATLVAAGQVAAASLISTQAAFLSEGVLKSMYQSKTKLALYSMLGIGLMAAAGWCYHGAEAGEQNQPPPAKADKPGSTAPAVGQKNDPDTKPAAGLADAWQGSWINIDPNANAEWNQFIITKKDNALKLSIPPQEPQEGESSFVGLELVDLKLCSTPKGDTATKAFMVKSWIDVTWYYTLHLEKDKLVVERYNIYSEDSTDKAHSYVRQVLKKKTSD